MTVYYSVQRKKKQCNRESEFDSQCCIVGDISVRHGRMEAPFVVAWYTLGGSGFGGSGQQPNLSKIATLWVDVRVRHTQWSAKTLKPLTGEVNNLHRLVTVQCSASKSSCGYHLTCSTHLNTVADQVPPLVATPRDGTKSSRCRLCFKIPQIPRTFEGRAHTPEVPPIPGGYSLDQTWLWPVKAWTLDLWRVSFGVWHQISWVLWVVRWGTSTSHRCSIRVGSEEFGGQVLSSLSRSSGHSWTVFVVWHDALRCGDLDWQSGSIWQACSLARI